jgi:hypothetical protein
MVHCPEEPQRVVEVGRLAEERPRRPRIECEAPGQSGIDRRAERLEVHRLAAEDLGERGQAAQESAAD